MCFLSTFLLLLMLVNRASSQESCLNCPGRCTNLLIFCDFKNSKALILMILMNYKYKNGCPYFVLSYAADVVTNHVYPCAYQPCLLIMQALALRPLSHLEEGTGLQISASDLIRSSACLLSLSGEMTSVNDTSPFPSQIIIQ